MATTVHEPPKISATVEEQQNRVRPNGGSGNGGAFGFNSQRRRVGDYSSPPSSTGMWVVLASIAMTFAALTSALVVRQGGAKDWQHLELPNILYWNTLVLIASTVSLEIARRKVASFMRARGEIKLGKFQAARWLYVTLALGLLFVAGQYIAWLQLRAQGMFLATNPNSSFFYVLTAMHAIHVIGGLGGLVRVLSKLHNLTLRKSTLDATCRYWHFMDALWVYLLVLLMTKL
jgi:cytochrome c oxidase subunit III